MPIEVNITAQPHSHARIAAVIREELDLRDFKGDQLYEGAIDPDELAAAIIEGLAKLSAERALAYRSETAKTGMAALAETFDVEHLVRDDGR